ncbi:MAG: permease [Pirellulaceae bacterium]|nr:permease [Pirellulaceae bacterium]
MSDRYRWAAKGDINAFFGLVLDNIAGLILIVSLLANFGMPPEFSLRYLIPGTALGVLFGDVCFFYLAFRLAKSSGNPNVTAMPLGLDTPSIFGTALFVVGPAFLKAKESLGDAELAAIHAWQIGICCLFMAGLFKFVCAFGANWARTTFPRAGLLGSLTAIALVLISFLPLLDIMSSPVVGMVALAIVLVSLVGRVPVPFRIPGTVAALIVAGLLHFIMVRNHFIPAIENSFEPSLGLFPIEWMSSLNLSWLTFLREASGYLPVVIPFALGTVVGGIDCTESAAAAGDHYSTKQVVGVEALATLFAALCGGVCQTTPYIGHPAYKAMGGRAAYCLATALAIGIGGSFGLIGYFYLLIPKAAVYPILIFIGLEITSQSFLATPKRHYAAVALACVPALAFLSVHFVGQIFNDIALREAKMGLDSLSSSALKESIMTAKLLANGFLLSGLLWSSGLAMAIDRRLNLSAAFFGTAGVLTLFGVIHSPLDSNAVFLPLEIPGLDPSWVLDSSLQNSMWSFAVAYFATAALLVAWGAYLSRFKPADSTELAEH